MPTLNNTIFDAGATSNKLTAEVAEFYSKVLLKRLTPKLQLGQFASKEFGSGAIPKRSGDTISFRKFASLAKVLTPLTEGVTPDGANLSVSKISAQVRQYGNFVQITDLTDDVALDDVKTQAVELLGENAGETIEAIINTTIFGGSTVYRSGGVATQLLTNSTITAADILNCLAMLKKANVKKINGDYVALISIKVAHDLMQLAEWKAVNTYNHDGQYSGEIGKLYGIRFIEIPEDFVTKYAGAGAGAADLYATLFMGADFFGMPDVAGSAKPKIYMDEPGGNNDPLHQRMTVGFKNLFVVKRLNEACAVRLESK